MFDLKFASIDLRKAAYLENINVGQKHASYKPVSDCSSNHSPQAIIADDNHNPIIIYKEDVEYAHRFTWSEIKEQR